MNRSTIITIIVALILVAVGVWYWGTMSRTTPEEEALIDVAETLSEAAGENLSSVVDTSVSAVGETPDANPLSQTNPFSGVKTNPFE